MPYKDLKRRRDANAQAVRAHRIFRAAVAAEDPLALEADRCRQQAQNPMRPANELADRIKNLPKEERAAHLPEYNRVRAQCAALDRDAAKARYLALRAQVIERASVAKLTFADLL